MNEKLKNRYIQTMFRFRKILLDISKSDAINPTELFVMAGIAKNLFGEGNSVSITEISHHTHITKAAVSQMFTSLEKRGYVIRETDRTNRRKITVELTQDGERVLAEAQFALDARLGDILSRFGEDKTEQLVVLMNGLLDTAERG